MTKCPPFFKKLCALIATIRAWSGWATSANIVSTIPIKKSVMIKTLMANPLHSHAVLILRLLFIRFHLFHFFSLSFISFTLKLPNFKKCRLGQNG